MPRSAARVVVRAGSGTVVSKVTANGAVLRTLLPIRVSGGGTGVVELDQDYRAIAAAARQTSYWVTGILEALLVVLWLLLTPALTRASVRLRRQVEQLDHAASHDELTGLLNRPGLRRLIDEALAGERPRGALLLVDLDRFHEINETVGAEHGDRLLVEVADRLRLAAAGRPVARLGEDEFAVLLTGVLPAGVEAVAVRTLEALAEPFTVDGIRLGLDAHAGVAGYPAHGKDSWTLLRHASIALTRAKSDVERVALYDDREERDDVGRLSVVAELRDALRRGELLVHYQPQVGLATGSVLGVEALIRWQHPERGLVTAGEFIGDAEQSGVISELGRFVLRTAIAQWRDWRDHGLALDVAVNLSTIDLLDVTLPGTIVDLLLEHEMPAEHLVLEITERTLLHDEHKSHRVLRQLERVGVRLAIDDYGIGYSSLAALRKLPVTQLKIDQSFVAGIPDDRANDTIVASTIDLAHVLGATVVAEGVETEAQLRRLSLLGCDSVQGYLIGRPHPPEGLTAELRRRHEVRREQPVAPAGDGARHLSSVAR